MSVSKSVFDSYVRSMDMLSSKAQDALLKVWPRIDTSSVDSMREDLLRYIPAIVERFGKASAALSARYYDNIRKLDNVDDEYIAITSDNTKFDEVRRDILYALSPEFAGASATAFLAGTLDRSVKQYGRDTLMLNAGSDSKCKGYVSIPSADACAFCIMKAIGMYKNYLGEPLETEVNSDAWHDHCNCQLMPVFENTVIPDKDRIEEYERMYNDGMKQAIEDAGGDATRSMSAREVLSGMRKANGINH